MSRRFGLVALVVFAAALGAQPQRSPISAARAQQLETSLKTNPSDRASRAALLEYYFQARINPAEAVPARRSQILWFIQNSPADQVLARPSATIDAAGHSLADPEGYRLAAEAWRVQVSKPAVSATALVNAALFFKLSDQTFTIQLLQRALGLEPSSKEVAARLGDQYALAILGVTMINRNGYPLGVDPRLVQSPSALEARQALTTSENPYTLAKAGYMLGWQGAILYFSRQLDFDPWPLAESALKRAVTLAPADPGVAAFMSEFRKMQQEAKRAGRGAARTMPAVSGRAAVIS